MSKQNQLTEMAAAFYAKALKDTSAGCCGSAKPVLAHDYAAGDLETAPQDAVANSFGCGDPLAFAAVLPGQTVLDLGSGAGLDLILAAERVGPEGHVIGLDASHEMIERARANIVTTVHTNVELRHGVMESMPVDDRGVDWVISNCVINLSPDKARVFAEIARVLKPGGHILVSDLVADELPDWVRGNADLYAACIAGAMSEADYVATAKTAGLEDVEVVDKLTYDGAMVSGLISDQLPVAMEALAESLGVDAETFAAMAAEAMDGKVHSIKLSARRSA